MKNSLLPQDLIYSCINLVNFIYLDLVNYRKNWHTLRYVGTSMFFPPFYIRDITSLTSCWIF